ncbi:hypothetical protein [Microbacterium sp. zg-YB36]|uniref:hypothetical protein n=1 Tax=Microbacterium sp. zg-YB36 TaxID=2969407 RepID=UPI00214B3B8E|nr:hypothetical protein [Microbacterium sp. zg-YB36]MDL5350917.1 hypothetical protein [Microbacterium sp. zg-YB36]
MASQFDEPPAGGMAWGGTQRPSGPSAAGGGHPLPRFRWWQSFARSLFHLRLVDPSGRLGTWSVDVRHGGDDDGIVWADLYRDGRHAGRSRLPGAFPVPGGRIEVETSGFGLRRAHYVAADGSERQLTPDPASAEGRRARLERTAPALSHAISATSMIVLVVALLLAVPQLVETVTQFPLIAETMGTFVSPVRLPAWLNIAVVVAGLAASTERALRLRYNRLLDGGLFDGDE